MTNEDIDMASALGMKDGDEEDEDVDDEEEDEETINN
jgi:hypothetical protein